VAKEGRLEPDSLIAHFMRVNECDQAAMVADRRANGRQWEPRSNHDWRLDLGEYAALVYDIASWAAR
jgi:hypothetical protein